MLKKTILILIFITNPSIIFAINQQETNYINLKHKSLEIQHHCKLKGDYNTESILHSLQENNIYKHQLQTNHKIKNLLQESKIIAFQTKRKINLQKYLKDQNIRLDNLNWHNQLLDRVIHSFINYYRDDDIRHNYY